MKICTGCSTSKDVWSCQKDNIFLPKYFSHKSGSLAKSFGRKSIIFLLANRFGSKWKRFLGDFFYSSSILFPSTWFGRKLGFFGEYFWQQFYLIVIGKVSQENEVFLANIFCSNLILFPSTLFGRNLFALWPGKICLKKKIIIICRLLDATNGPHWKYTSL